MEERRKDRSAVRIEAIRKQLSHVAEEGGYELILLADQDGKVLTHSNPTEGCAYRELDSFGHLLSGIRDLLATLMDIHDIEEADVSRRDGCRLICRFFEFGKADFAVLLVTKGPERHADLIDKTVRGVRRILSAADMKM